MLRFFKERLDPAEQMSEILFGLIMTLTFTLGAGIVVKDGPEATRQLLTGVLGCNLAWGVIDGLFCIFNRMYERGALHRAARLRASAGPAAVEEAVGRYLKENLGGLISEDLRRQLKRELADGLPENPPPVRVTRDDLLAALATGILVILTSLPAILPFALLDDRMVALRTSNLVMVSLLYLVGYRWARAIDAPRHLTGLALALGGLMLVQATILLGG